jgi:hypothetical protein
VWRIGAASDGCFAEHHGIWEACTREKLDQPARRIPAWRPSPKRRQNAIRGLLPKRNVWQGVKRPIDDQLMQCEDSPGSRKKCSPLEERDGIDLVEQNVPGDHEIERYGVGKGIEGRLREGNMRESLCLCPLLCDSKNLRIAVDANDHARRADELAAQHRDVARAATQIENAHATRDAGAPQQTFGDRPKDRSLVDQAPDLGRRMPEHIRPIINRSLWEGTSDTIAGRRVLDRRSDSVGSFGTSCPSVPVGHGYFLPSTRGLCETEAMIPLGNGDGQLAEAAQDIVNRTNFLFDMEAPDPASQSAKDGSHFQLCHLTPLLHVIDHQIFLFARSRARCSCSV